MNLIRRIGTVEIRDNFVFDSEFIGFNVIFFSAFSTNTVWYTGGSTL